MVLLKDSLFSQIFHQVTRKLAQTAFHVKPLPRSWLLCDPYSLSGRPGTFVRFYLQYLPHFTLLGRVKKAPFCGVSVTAMSDIKPVGDDS